MIENREWFCLIAKEINLYKDFLKFLSNKANLKINEFPEELNAYKCLILIDTHLSEKEYQSLTNFVLTGGILIIFLDNLSKDNNLLNFCKYFGVSFLSETSDVTCLISLTASGLHHPRECTLHYYDKIDNLFLSRNLEDSYDIKFSFVYPFGIALYPNVIPNELNRVCQSVLNSGSFVYPQNTSICTLTTIHDTNGKLCCIGSKLLFSDKYIHKFQNQVLRNALFEFIFALSIETQGVKQYTSNSEKLPNITSLSLDVKPCHFFNLKFDTSLLSHSELPAQNEIKEDNITLIDCALNSLHFLPIGNFSKPLVKIYNLAEKLDVDVISSPIITPLPRAPFKRFYPPLQMMYHPLIIPFPEDSYELPSSSLENKFLKE